MIHSQILFDVQSKINMDNWTIVNDDVMGGRSQSDFGMNTDGYAEFSGTVSLENYGGFASVRNRLHASNLNDNKHVLLFLKGDGKNYQFRLKHKKSDYHSYVYTFPTQGNWEEIKIPINAMQPQFRGRQLNMANFNHESIEEMAFLIANKKDESFELVIKSIEIQ
ncbi:MAG: CIA30 family protein [Flavobacteriaceae bacterium]